MSKERITLAIAKLILRMLDGEKIPSSTLPKALARQLSDEELLGSVSHGSRVSYYILDRDACRSYIQSHYFNGYKIEKWIELKELSDEALNRSVLVNEIGDSKFVSIRTFRGFLVNCCEPIQIQLCGKPVTLSPMDGLATFIQKPESFSIPSDVLVVGIENGENFNELSRQRYLFPYEKILFVSRYPQSLDLRTWLSDIPNSYLHFGDFDLAGINIYLTEFYKYLGARSAFYVPDDIEERIKKGNSNLYDKQYAKFKNMKITDERLMPLVNLIHQYHRVYEQEGYIE